MVRTGQWCIIPFLLFFSSLSLSSETRKPRVIETVWGKVTLSLVDKDEPEPPSRSSWLIAEIECKNKVKATIKEGVCDTAFSHTLEDETLVVQYYVLDHAATSEAQKEICLEKDPFDFEINLEQACKKKTTTKKEK